MSIGKRSRVGSERVARPEWSSPEVADAIHDLLREHAVDGEGVASTRWIGDELGISQATAWRGLARLEQDQPARLALLRRGSSRGYGTRYRVLEQHAPTATPAA